MGYIGSASVKRPKHNPCEEQKPFPARNNSCPPVGRWPLAVALVATPCVMPALEARAGTWEIIGAPSYSGSTHAQEEAYATQWSDYYSGQVTTLSNGAPSGSALNYPTPPTPTTTTRKLAIAGQRQMLREQASGTGGAAQIIVDGKVRYKVRWKRNMIPNPARTAMIPDVTDNPPKFFYLAMNVKLTAQSQDASGVSGIRDPFKESASASIVLEGPTQNLYPGYTSTLGQNINSNTVSTAALTRVIKMDAVGREEFWTPWIELKAYANLAGNRSHTTYSIGDSNQQYPRTTWRDGVVSVLDNSSGPATNAWSVSNLNLTLSPSPDQLALDDGVPSTAPLNQYLINEGILPTSITVQSNDTIFTDYLRANSSWSLTGTAPALRPRLANVKAEANGTATIRPQHPGLNGSPTPENGWKFNVQTSATPSSTSNVGWNFPDQNAYFGVRTFTHHIRAVNIDAPVALFYPSTGFQHPTGGPQGYNFQSITPPGGTSEDFIDLTSSVQTPNYIYYYNKAWTNPWNIPVVFWPNTLSQWDSNYNFVAVGLDAHGLSGRPIGNKYVSDTDLFALVPSTDPNKQFVQWVGHQKTRGLDLYARCVYHECVHKRLYDTRYSTGPDNDADGVPDSIERAVQLNPLAINTANFSYGDDNEVFCRMCERDYNPGTTLDWADDGFNFGRVAAPNLLQRQVDYMWGTYTHGGVRWCDARPLVP